MPAANVKLRYAGFWPRFAASLLELAVLSPFMVLWYWGVRHEIRLYLVYHHALVTLAGLVLNVHVVKRWGGSPGMLIMGLRITDCAGRPVGAGRAFTRYLPWLVLYVLRGAGIAVVLVHISDAQYAHLDRNHIYKALDPVLPIWAGWSIVGAQIWTWSELLTMLTNEKRRALHDFIAGTVVIHATREGSASMGAAASTAEPPPI